jgi:hypothetical protein
MIRNSKARVASGLLGLLLLLPGGVRAAENAREIRVADRPSSTGRDLLVFRNGDQLYGSLESIQGGEGLVWRRADVEEPITFKLENVREIQFPRRPARKPLSGLTSQIRLTNGDSVDGSLLEFGPDGVVLDTWYASRLSIPRAAVQTIFPRPPATQAVFDGPTGLEGWTVGTVRGMADGGEWRYRDGAFFANRPASIARDMKLPDLVRIEFDLAWYGTFNLAVALYTDYLHPINLASKDAEPPFGGFYSLQINNYMAHLMAITQTEPIRYLGQLPIHMLQLKNAAHVELLINKARNSISLLLDGNLIKQWVDPEGFIGKGTGLRLVHQGQGVSRISSLRITEWDGHFEDKVSTNSAPAHQDLARLKNGDRVAGRAGALRDGKFSFEIPGGVTLDVPFERIRHIDLGGEKADLAPSPDQVQVHLAAGGSLTMTLEKWDAEELVATSRGFGRAVLNPAAVERIEFLKVPSGE